ncbi:hypothetical protein H8B09_17745 [Paenibacillus sp. PR3]|uniref:Uncharacterized protein n=1 Tax=Paenibacillus terricola TaxID=2763503 RepID=A0ABR8MXB9_9BACL|nr:hypothetical protein [Paenibacillus terricola]MBD3920612.1 hypothetical protein [Paenibacillus terricola]
MGKQESQSIRYFIDEVTRWIGFCLFGASISAGRKRRDGILNLKLGMGIVACHTGRDRDVLQSGCIDVNGS